MLLKGMMNFRIAEFYTFREEMLRQTSCHQMKNRLRNEPFLEHRPTNYMDANGVVRPTINYVVDTV